jgi:beta-galactosidase
MLNLLLLALMISGRDTIITSLASPSAAGTRSAASSNRAPAPALITIQILNTSITPLRNVLLEWALQTNGAITRSGNTIIPILPAQHPTPVRLPIRLPADTAGESLLLLRYRPANSPIRPAPGPPTSSTFLEEQQIGLRPWRPGLTVAPAGEITLTDSNDTFTIHSPLVRICFNRQTGWLVHYEIKGNDLLDDTLGLKSNFYLPRYNDSAPSAEPHLQLFSTTSSPELIIVRSEYTLPAAASLLHVSYTINASGEMLVTQQVEPDTTQSTPRTSPLPGFGMQWNLPAGYDSITGYGPLDSTRIGIFHDRPTTASTPGLHISTASTRSNIRCWTITDKEGNGLQFIADTQLLNVSAFLCFDGNLRIAPNQPVPRLPIRINIDRAALPNVERLASMGILRYSYKVKPLFTSRISNHH